MKNRRDAFSLVEVLTSVTIVALLLAALVPSLGSARRQAQTVVCGSNLRQLALGNELYAAEHAGAYCPGAADFVTGNLQRWHGTRERASEPFRPERGPLTRFLGEEQRIRACPALRIELPAADSRRFEQNCGGYGYNQAYIGQRLERPAPGDYRLVTDRLGAAATQIRRPSATVMFADSAFVDGALIEYSFAEPRFHPLLRKRTRADPSIHFRHVGRANVAWCDGSVDRRERTFTWRSGLYRGDPAAMDIGWFGRDDDNGWFDLD